MSHRLHKEMCCDRGGYSYCQLAPWNRMYLKKLTLDQMTNKSLVFMEPIT